MPTQLTPRPPRRTRSRKDPRLMTPQERIRAQEPWEIPALIGLSLLGIVGWAVIVFGGIS